MLWVARVPDRPWELRTRSMHAVIASSVGAFVHPLRHLEVLHARIAVGAGGVLVDIFRGQDKLVFRVVEERHLFLLRFFFLQELLFVRDFEGETEGAHSVSMSTFNATVEYYSSIWLLRKTPFDSHNSTMDNCNGISDTRFRSVITRDRPGLLYYTATRVNRSNFWQGSYTFVNPSRAGPGFFTIRITSSSLSWSMRKLKSCSK